MTLKMLMAALFLAVPLSAAKKPKFPATEVFDKVLEAEEALAWSSAKILKEEQAAGDKNINISRGFLRSMPGGKARLELTEPSQGLIVSDGKSLWVELPEVEQVMRYSSTKLREGGNFFLDLAPTIRHYSKASYRRLVEPGPDYDSDLVSALELQPLKPKEAGFELLRVWVNQDDWSIIKVRLDYGGTQSTIRFLERRRATKKSLEKHPERALEPSLFKYKAPKGFEVFDLEL